MSHLKQMDRARVWTSFVAVAAGLASATAIITVAAREANEPIAPLVFGYLVVANTFLLLTVAILTLVYIDGRRNKQKTATRAEQRASAILNHLNTIVETRTGLSAFLLRNRFERTQLDACIQQSSTFLRFVVDETRAIFQEYTGHPCAVSIKLLVSSEKDTPDVVTYLRDTASYFVRKDLYKNLYPADGRYPYDKHSPFVKIVSGQKDYFLSNDLRSEPNYENGNQHWPKLYNATLIVAIREPGVTASENILGFLCIDSLTAKFDEAVAVPIGRIMANTVFYVIHSLSVFERELQNQKKIA